MSSLYLHIPFCERKCLYCDFYSIESRAPMEGFLDALEREIRAYKAYGALEPVSTLFLGGGTPSLLSPPQLERIMGSLREHFTIAADAEVTLETNPGTVSGRTIAAFRSLGVNRLSIGIQSFRAEELRFLDRIHDAHQAEACVRMARAEGFANVSVDLIYALPGQTALQWEETLSRALSLEPDHVSAYSLIVEQGTPLARLVAEGTVVPAAAEQEAILYEGTMAVMKKNGFEHYEVSSYARPGFTCRHNIAYWTHENYLGFGPSAHSFWMEKNSQSAVRWANVANIASYGGFLGEGKLPVTMREDIGRAQMMNERLFLGLRSGGIDLQRWKNDFGAEFPAAQRNLAADLEREGRVILGGDSIRLTDHGYMVCDEIAARLMI